VSNLRDISVPFLSSRRKRLLAGFITLIAALSLVVSVSSAAATPTDLFFSEYIEGSSNNKALAIFNGTGAGDQRAVSTSGADRTGFMRFADTYYLYNLSGRALPDPSGTYRVEMTLPNGQVATASFGVKP
jgi:hypothetical protein